jgi:hypothetical protein
MEAKRKKQIPLFESIVMIFNYAKTHIIDQLKLVAFVILYLSLFQIIILKVPLSDALGIAGGIGLVILGLALFLEGLFLGLMPVGERVGVKLPAKVGITVIAIFGLILGFGSTLAEPAISALRTAGQSVTAWDAPLLYMLLEIHTEPLVLSIGTGVGIAVVFGMIRFYYGLSLKPFVYIIIPLLLVVSAIMTFHPNLSTIIGLAWDSGAVTTGAVTVPLVLALGIGVSRATGKSESSSGGFGIIMLASAFPVLSVLSFSLYMNTKAPVSTDEASFFNPEKREQALLIFEDEEALAQHAFTRGTETGRKSFYGNEEDYLQALTSLKTDAQARTVLLGGLSFDNWLTSIASDSESRYLSNIEAEFIKAKEKTSLTEVFKEEGAIALRAVIPLSIFLLLVLFLFLKQRLRFHDEIALGIIFTLIGMTLLTSGIRLGLDPLGSQVGSQLPLAFQTEEEVLDRVYIKDFDENLLINTVTLDGEQKRHFFLAEQNDLKKIEFKEENYDKEKGLYEYLVTRAPMFPSNLTFIGIGLIFLFAFGMGLGATLAEPGLNALGKTVEDLTVGAIKRKKIIFIVAIGVGLGLMAGVARIMYDIPTIWLLIPPYLTLIPLTYMNEDNFTSIAWDCGGVTTGPVTVPLVLAMGLSIGSEMNVIDGFGVLAQASVYPIFTVLLFGVYNQYQQRKSLKQTNEE